MAGKNIITIEDLAEEKDTATLFGVVFTLLSQDDFAIKDQAHLMRIGRRIIKMSEQEVSDTEAEVTALELRKFCWKIVPDLRDSPEIDNKLKDSHRMALLRSFMGEMPGNQNQTQAQTSPSKTEQQRLAELEAEMRALGASRNTHEVMSLVAKDLSRKSH